MDTTTTTRPAPEQEADPRAFAAALAAYEAVLNECAAPSTGMSDDGIDAQVDGAADAYRALMDLPAPNIGCVRYKLGMHIADVEGRPGVPVNQLVAEYLQSRDIHEIGTARVYQDLQRIEAAQPIHTLSDFTAAQWLDAWLGVGGTMYYDPQEPQVAWFGEPMPPPLVLGALKAVLPANLRPDVVAEAKRRMAGEFMLSADSADARLQQLYTTWKAQEQALAEADEVFEAAHDRWLAALPPRPVAARMSGMDATDIGVASRKADDGYHYYCASDLPKLGQMREFNRVTLEKRGIKRASTNRCDEVIAAVTAHEQVREELRESTGANAAEAAQGVLIDQQIATEQAIYGMPARTIEGLRIKAAVTGRYWIKDPNAYEDEGVAALLRDLGVTAMQVVEQPAAPAAAALPAPVLEAVS